jgi:hypothetical protein
LSEPLQEIVPPVITSTDHPPLKNLNAETVTTMAGTYLKRLGHKNGVKPKRVSLEEGTYTVEFELSKFTAVVRIDAENREIKEYDVQPKGEESSMFSLSPKTILTVGIISSMINVALFFGFKMLGL